MDSPIHRQNISSIEKTAVSFAAKLQPPVWAPPLCRKMSPFVSRSEIILEDRARQLYPGYQNSKTGVYTSTPKTKSSRRNLRLSDELLSYLRRYKMEKNIARVLYIEKWQDSDRLFTTETGAPLTPNTPYSWLQRFCERYDLPFKGLHSFRHAFASEMIASKQVDIKTVSAILGHSQTSTTLNIYAHEVQTASAAAQSCVYDLIEARRKNA